MKLAACPCGGASYNACCRKLHTGTRAPDALSLMRSRYSAYVLGLNDYLRETWHDSTRPDALDEHTSLRTWLGLSIRRHSATDDQATVEFIARYRVNGRGQRLHEVSRFVREAGRWYYLDGDLA